MSQAATAEAVIRQLKWRYATKKFDPTRKISPEDWHTLEQALVLAPSSFGMQPWRFYVVTDPAVRQQLRPAAWNQSQITDASHLVVFAARKGLAEADVEKYMQRIAHVRGMPASALADFRGMISGFLKGPHDTDAWGARQVYIALGIFLETAALLQIDTCPMEGFEPAKIDAILKLPEAGYTATVIATAGYRAADDGYGKLAKVRFAHEHVITHV